MKNYPVCNELRPVGDNSMSNMFSVLKRTFTILEVFTNKKIKPTCICIFQDLDKLQSEVNNVYRSLRYIKAVVDQEKLQIVPNTATVILDTVMDVFTILNSFFMNQDRY